MSAQEVLAAVIRARYDQSPPGKWPMEDSLAEYVLEHLPAKGIAVVELPEPDGPLGLVGGAAKGLAWRRVADPDAEAGGVATVALSGYSGDILASISCLQTPDDARWAAAALLAAADAAERAS